MEACAGIVAESGVVASEITKREAVQMPAVSRIAERTEVRVMRRRDVDFPAPAEETMELFYRLDDIRYVLNDMHCADRIEAAIRKRVGQMIEVAQHIRTSSRDAVNADRAGIFIYPATDVEDGAGSRVFRHSSSVSMAQSA